MILMTEYGSTPPQIMALIHPHDRKGGIVAVWGTETMHTGFWWEDMQERCHLEDPNTYTYLLTYSMAQSPS